MAATDFTLLLLSPSADRPAEPSPAPNLEAWGRQSELAASAKARSRHEIEGVYLMPVHGLRYASDRWLR